MNTNKLRLASAALGAGALVGMGVFTVAMSTDSDTAAVLSHSTATLGETTTIEKAASTPETTMAVPEVTADVPDGFGP